MSEDEKGKPGAVLPSDRPIAASWDDGTSRGTPARDKIMTAGKIVAGLGATYGGYQAVQGIRGAMDTMNNYSATAAEQAGPDAMKVPSVTSPAAAQRKPFNAAELAESRQREKESGATPDAKPTETLGR